MTSIHFSFYSFVLPLSLCNLFLLIWLLLSCNLFYYYYLLLFIMIIMWSIISTWINDYFIESFMTLITNEENNIMMGIKLMMVSEVFLFFGCFWSNINSSLLLNCYSLFYLFPILSSYAFAIPFTNLLILVFSSFPLNGGQISIKLGNYNYLLLLLSNNMCYGMLFMMLQLKEFIMCFFSMNNTFIGSIYFFIISLHGFMYY